MTTFLTKNTILTKSTRPSSDKAVGHGGVMEKRSVQGFTLSDKIGRNVKFFPLFILLTLFMHIIHPVK